MTMMMTTRTGRRTGRVVVAVAQGVGVMHSSIGANTSEQQNKNKPTSDTMLYVSRLPSHIPNVTPNRPILTPLLLHSSPTFPLSQARQQLKMERMAATAQQMTIDNPQLFTEDLATIDLKVREGVSLAGSSVFHVTLGWLTDIKSINAGAPILSIMNDGALLTEYSKHGTTRAIWGDRDLRRCRGHFEGAERHHEMLKAVDFKVTAFEFKPGSTQHALFRRFVVYNDRTKSFMTPKGSMYLTGAAGKQGLDVPISDLPRDQIHELDWAEYFNDSQL